MTERTAAEILLAQCEAEVAEAKDNVQSLSPDSIETLIDKVVTRWWIKRIANRPPIHAPSADLAERQGNRIRMLAASTARIQDRSGPIKSEAIQINLLGAVADINALWGVLIELGLVTPEMRQDYLDESVSQTFMRIEDQAQKMILTEAPNGRSQ
jgi:hypothetical protein